MPVRGLPFASFRLPLNRTRVGTAVGCAFCSAMLAEDTDTKSTKRVDRRVGVTGASCGLSGCACLARKDCMQYHDAFLCRAQFASTPTRCQVKMRSICLSDTSMALYAFPDFAQGSPLPARSARKI